MGRTKAAVAALTLTAATLLTGPVAATAAPATTTAAKHACTKDSKHHCIRGGEFCPKASYSKSGWDQQGRRYVCKGNRTHPHWSKP